VRDHRREIDDVRSDIETLRAMIDLSLDQGATAEDMHLSACARVLDERKRRLTELESITLYISRGNGSDTG
jgi:hypothetical protein